MSSIVMLEVTQDSLITWSEIGHRDVFGKTIIDNAQRREGVVVLTADLSDATRVTEYSKLFPNRFFNVGVEEQNMIGIAAGLALSRKTAFTTTFASFASLRVCEQIRDDVVYQYVRVKIVGIDNSVATSNLGVTHYGWEDIAILRGIPNIVILSPSDGLSVMKLTCVAAEHDGPVYVRLSGGKPIPVVYEEDRTFEIGKSITVRSGRDVTLVGTGLIVSRAIDAANMLQEKGITVRVVDMYCIKLIDKNVLRQAAVETELIVTVEEHTKIGGLGGAVAEVFAEIGNTPPLVRLGFSDEFCHIDSQNTLLERFGLTCEGMCSTVLDNINSRKVNSVN